MMFHCTTLSIVASFGYKGNHFSAKISHFEVKMRDLYAFFTKMKLLTHSMRCFLSISIIFAIVIVHFHYYYRIYAGSVVTYNVESDTMVASNLAKVISKLNHI